AVHSALFVTPVDCRLLTADSFHLLLRGLLLAGDRLFARALAGASVRVRALATDRKIAAVPHPPVTPDVHQPLDVHGDVPAQVAFDLDVVGDDLAYPRH